MSNKKISFEEVLKLITNDNICLYYSKETKTISDITYFYKEYKKNHKTNNQIPYLSDLNIIELPRYKDIDHKSIMSFYVKECIEDKNIRKELFYALRNYEYYDKFMDLIKKYNLEEEYDMCTIDLYVSIIDDWKEKNNIT